MRFEARAAAKPPSGDHMTFERLQASTNRKSWTYRDKSAVDSRRRQVKLGEWPAMSFAGAIAEHILAREAEAEAEAEADADATSATMTRLLASSRDRIQRHTIATVIAGQNR
ncbi:hypothetical protein [Paraburkholderia kururiensis]|nr:hypothetical protein [Paraburkholderia kururiensis]